MQFQQGNQTSSNGLQITLITMFQCWVKKNHFSQYRIIAVSTGKSFNFRTWIPREKRKSTNEIAAGKTILIKQYLHNGIKAIVSVKLRSIKDIKISSDIYKSRKVDLLWLMGYFSKKQFPGFMHRHINGELS